MITKAVGATAASSGIRSVARREVFVRRIAKRFHQGASDSTKEVLAGLYGWNQSAARAAAGPDDDFHLASSVGARINPPLSRNLKPPASAGGVFGTNAFINPA